MVEVGDTFPDKTRSRDIADLEGSPDERPVQRTIRGGRTLTEDEIDVLLVIVGIGSALFCSTAMFIGSVLGTW